MSIDLNIFSVVGRLTRDGEFSRTTNGTSLGKLSIAVNDKKGQEDTVSFFDITVWGKTAEAVFKYTKKGDRIGVTGKLVQERWQDKAGQNRSKVVINANTIQFLEGKKDNNGGQNYQQNPNQNQNYQQPQPQNPDPFQSNNQTQNNGFTNIDKNPDPFQTNTNQASSNNSPFQNQKMPEQKNDGFGGANKNPDPFQNVDFNNSDNEEIPF